MSSYPVKGYSEGAVNQKPTGPSFDKSKEWQMELLMEKLRTKSSQFKSFVECAKAVRMALLEKRYAIDSVERSQLQKCLDTLQHSIKVTSLQGMVERLESVSRQLGLKFVAGPTGFDWFISSDMFYLEVVLEPTGSVKDVKIHHEGKVEQQSCEELVLCLSRGDFADFTAQLEGLASIYQLNAEKKVKCKAFSALQGLEADLGALAQLQNFIKEPFNLVHKSPVGILQKRRGGHAMRLTYLVPPYELLDPEKHTMHPLTAEEVINKGLGFSVTVCVEGSATHKLQTAPLISINRSPGGKSTPQYAPLTAANSALLPAVFSLRLAKPMPVCVSLVRRIQQITEVEFGDITCPQPLLDLIVQTASEGHIDSSRGLIVHLPDQQHCYYMTETRGTEGIIVSSIPFTHPGHVPQILGFLRQQALFNVLVSSCVRRPVKQDAEKDDTSKALTGSQELPTVFEVTALSAQSLSVSFEHPLEENMATAELELTDIGNLRCRVYGTGCDAGTVAEMASRVLQRSLSIPVTMRSLLRSWHQQAMRGCGGPNECGTPAGNQGGPGSGGGRGPPGFDGGPPIIKTEPDGGQSGCGGGIPGPGGADGGWPAGVGGPGRRRALPPHKTSPWHRGLSDADIGSTGADSSASDSDSSTSDTQDHGASDRQGSDFTDAEMFDVPEVEAVKPRKSKKDRKASPQPVILEASESKSLVPPSVSITAVPSSVPSSVSVTGAGGPSLNSVLTGMGLERRPGIEIIPIVPAPAPVPTSSLQSSITITPIPGNSSGTSGKSSGSGGEDRSRERKAGKSKDDKGRVEKKRKRKREESPGMGPPDKLPLKQTGSEGTSKHGMPAAASSPKGEVRASSPQHKSSVSPTRVSKSGSGTTNVSGSGPVGGAPIGAVTVSPSGARHSPKRSPSHYGTGSPKHHGSPKSGTPGSGSGKPSMSALKSAAASPGKSPVHHSVTSVVSISGSSERPLKSSSKDKDRERDRQAKATFSVSSGSGSGSSPKLKSSSVKLKQLDLSSSNLTLERVNTSCASSGGTTPPSGTSGSGSSSGGKGAPGTNPTGKRKGSLSAVIDKLTAQHCEQGDSIVKDGSRSGGVPGTVGAGGNSGNTTGPKQPGEYMVKPSSDGIKLTINKTRTKDSKPASRNQSSGSSTGSTGSPKTHTGLKPGVNSGPASKKPHSGGPPRSQTSPSNGTTSGSASTAATGTGVMTVAASSGSVSGARSPANTSNKTGGSGKAGSSKTGGSKQLGGSPKTGTRDGKTARPAKGSSDRLGSPFGAGGKPGDSRKGSGAALGTDTVAADPFRTGTSSKLEVALPPLKSLDTKFQIPKLSARNSGSNSTAVSLGSDRSTVVDRVIQPVQDRPDSKFVPGKSVVAEGNKSPVPGTRQVLSLQLQQTPSQPIAPPRPSSPSARFPVAATVAGSLSVLPSGDNSSEMSDSGPIADTVSSHAPSAQEAAELLLDFSAAKQSLQVAGPSIPCRRRSPPPPLPPPPPAFPAGSPSVSVHIVKSPAPAASPLVTPSPHSVSPCITDDELMDEALVGMGK
ncbi:mediator of RNA polymerase II transcription subunit 1-like [Schistocerca americana]|uniref:mediator of RNA polymerase II transcription subunit 1-like n=1 Tax=Schistocerca americana TaxID=7009 RepID=UPI001F4FCE6D|nr:mediator of RNA polymerase II transcription subunit 1-like [Schistocerca americana]XP_047110708.1 mediator of RNA polymerase II transcription subunit 1-like [Schistocerca piceifrons]